MITEALFGPNELTYESNVARRVIGDWLYRSAQKYNDRLSEIDDVDSDEYHDLILIANILYAAYRNLNDNRDVSDLLEGVLNFSTSLPLTASNGFRINMPKFLEDNATYYGNLAKNSTDETVSQQVNNTRRYMANLFYYLKKASDEELSKDNSLYKYRVDSNIYYKNVEE